MRPAAILSSALLLAATSSAWPSMLSNPVDTLKREIAPMLIQRQDDSSSTQASSARSSGAQESSASRTGDNESASRTSASASSTASGDNNDQDDENGDETGSSSSGTARKTGTITGSPTKSGSKSTGTGTKTDDSSSKEFDPRMPAGGVSMITPDAMSPASYYKIKDQITFAWNYTSLSKAPSYIDVLASCSANNNMYTIASNETWDEQQTVIWDTGKYQATGTIPLLTETYTLVIHDAQKDVSATAGSGYLGTWKQFTFGMYEPQPYTPMADYVCATCSSAMSLMEKQTYAFMFSMVGVTLFTFGWFTGAAGVW